MDMQYCSTKIDVHRVLGTGEHGSGEAHKGNGWKPPQILGRGIRVVKISLKYKNDKSQQ